MKVKSLSRVRLLATPWTAAYQAPLPMGFSRQEYWSGLPLPSPIVWEDLAKEVEKMGAIFRVAPVSGGVEAAQSGDLTFVVGGVLCQVASVVSYSLRLYGL